MRMRLNDYLNSVGSARALARVVGVSDVMVSQWRAEQKTPAPAMCVLIERATDGVVRRWDLRPSDWSRIWPELIGQPGAPAVPSEARAA